MEEGYVFSLQEQLKAILESKSELHQNLNNIIEKVRSILLWCQLPSSIKEQIFSPFPFPAPDGGA